MSEISFTIESEATIGGVMAKVFDMVMRGIKAGPVVITLGRETKSREQEKKYHALIGDIAKTVDMDGVTYSVEAWKALLVDSYEQELRSMGEALTHPSRVVLSLDGLRAITVRASTKKFKKAEGSGFITYLYQFGSEHGAVFSDQSEQIYREAA
jgi:hypothetical protein